MNIKKLIRTKKFWAGVSAVVALVAGWMTGTTDSGNEFIELIGAFILAN